MNMLIGVAFGIGVLALFAGTTAFGLEPGHLDYKEIKLANGLRVITLEDFSCPIVTVDVWYHVGSKDEHPDRQGFAHMFEHMMFRGTDRLGPTSHFDYITQIGGHCNAYTSFDQTVYWESVPSNQLELALWLEAERMSFLKIDQSSFDTERKVVEEERRLRFNQPYGTLDEKALAEIYKVHPYRWSPIGNIPDLRASSVPELRAFWTRYYVPNNATLIIAGAVKHQEAEALAKKYFDWIPRYDEPLRVTVREPMPDKPRDVTLKLDNAPAPLVGVAFRTAPLASDDIVPLNLLGTILGEGQSSRAYRRLVQGRALGHTSFKKALAVDVRCMDFSLEQDGVMAVGAALPLSHGEPDKALAALKDEIAKVRATKVKPRELEKAKNQMMRRLVTESLYVTHKASVLGQAAVLEGDTARVNRRLEDIRKTTADDLLRVARQYMDPNRAMAFHVEGDLKGMLAKKKNPEDDAPITGQPETNPPPPGRPGAARPADYPATAPLHGLLDFDPTPHFETRTLSNGLKVVVVENHEVPFISIELGLLAGAWTETKPGCAAMTMQMLGQATKKHSVVRLSEELDRYAIEINGWASMDNAMLSTSCVTDQIERAMRLMGEVVLTPTFKARDFDRCQKQAVTQLGIAAAEPSYLAERELKRQLYGNHPYAREVRGEIKDVRALEPADLKKWWATFARPDMACLYFAGDITPDRAVKLAEAAFGPWKTQGPKPEVKVPPMPGLEKTHIYLVDKPGNQSQIRIAQRGITRRDPDYFTSRVLNGYFGGAFGSRLNESLRVKKGLTYGAGGGFNAQHMAGEFDVSTFSKTETTPDAVQAAIDEIKRLKADPPNDKEINQTKAFLVGSFAGNRETPQAVANDLWLIESDELPGDFFNRYLKGIQTTEPDACLLLAQKLIDPDRLVIVVVGQAKDLKKKLEAIAPVTVVASETTETTETK